MVLGETPATPSKFEIKVSGTKTQAQLTDQDLEQFQPQNLLQPLPMHSTQELIHELVSRDNQTPLRMKMLIDSLY